MLLFAALQIFVYQNVVHNFDEQVAPCVAPDDDHDYSIYGCCSLPGRRAEYFANVGEDVGEIVQVGHDGAEWDQIAKNVAEVQTVRRNMMYQHLFVVSLLQLF